MRKNTSGRFIQHIAGKPAMMQVTRVKNRSKLGYKEVITEIPATRGKAIKHKV